MQGPPHPRNPARLLRGTLAIALALLAGACARSETEVQRANRDGILLFGNAAEPQGIDPHLVSGVIESNIILSVLEGLVGEHPSIDQETLPGAASHWTSNDTKDQWTFHLQPQGRWSDGEPVTASDFVFSWRRMLTPELGAKYSDMLFFIDGAEEFNRRQRGRIAFLRTPPNEGPAWEDVREVAFGPGDAAAAAAAEGLTAAGWTGFSDEQRHAFVRARGLDALDRQALEWIAADPESRYHWPDHFPHTEAVLERLLWTFDHCLWELSRVGATAIDDFTLQVDLVSPTPFLPFITRHYTWFPVPEHVIMARGRGDTNLEKMTDIGSDWTHVEHFVGNGPFVPTQWRFGHFIEVGRNPLYWDADNVSLNGIRFLAIQNFYTEARTFIADAIHTTYSVPAELVPGYSKRFPESFRQEPYVGTSFLRFNTERGPLGDPRVRHALSLAIDRQALSENLTFGFEPALSLTPHMGDYSGPDMVRFNPEKARQLLAEAGFPNGEGFPSTPPLRLLTSGREASRTRGEVFQAMWRQHLGIHIDLESREWTTYLATVQNKNFDIVDGGWIGDYLDPTTFLLMWTRDNGNNNTNWWSPEYEEFLRLASMESDAKARYQLLYQAETILLNEAPIAPITWFVRNYFLHPSVENWHPKLLDKRPYKFLRLNPDS